MDRSSAFRARRMSFLRGRKEGSTAAKVSVFVKLRMREGWMEVVSVVDGMEVEVGIRSGRRRVVMSGMSVPSKSSSSVVGREVSSLVFFLDFFWKVSVRGRVRVPSCWIWSRSLCR